jgi:hypothetical protein
VTERAPIMGDARYSHAHYWDERAPRCGLACTNDQTGQHIGECYWPKEPGLPWCGRHTGEFIAKMRAQGYQVAHVRAVLPQLGFDARAIETFVAFYERTLKKAALEAARGVPWVTWQEAAEAPQEAPPAPAPPSVVAEPEPTAEPSVAPARKPRGL